jgi:hypothetical protein
MDKYRGYGHPLYVYSCRKIKMTCPMRTHVYPTAISIEAPSTGCSFQTPIALCFRMA